MSAWLDTLMEYSADRPCPKCGSGFVVTKYNSWIKLMWRKCERCEHSWAEKPLDA